MKKISRRSFLAAAGVSAAALALTACGGSSNSTAASTATSAAASTASAGDAAAAASDPKVTLVYAEVNPLDTIVGQTGSHFKEKVEELTGGSVVVDVQASGVLGSENDVLDAILGGSTSIDISRISAFALTSYGCNKSKLLSIPFTFENRAHFWNFANSELAPEFLNEPQELGLPPQQGKQPDLILPDVQQKLHLVGGEDEDVREGEKLHHRVPQGLFAGPESRAERGDKADWHTGGAGGVQRGKMGVAAGAVHEAGAGKGQHFSICGPVSAQLFGCIEQLRRTGAAA